ncbi:substrate-binding protein [Kaistia dalseonensis]|uniref:Branched-chain amino acid transport system substrate-binding protein/urea transport system substrate-binding protein n=1 Tax=Kaistia dalseonensis TaxID=410840 RepID=A0ABU0H5F8_9HYPH|nr:substrate-binding protein [Kaistia dalseonensis]MCX5494955.1 substrate-binding protein [Kaistia dalseonensis]MDQ0437536.1 branched-chain amino acid transport system substrate-binding protein/urea transport system substrate-binding protein [Kaistia dalseonensis]
MTSLTRRTLLKTGAGAALAATLPMPALLAAEPIKIGVVQPFSGGLELFGGQAKIGLDLAAAEINAAGGILGRNVELIYEDDKTDPKTAVERTTSLIRRDKVIAVSGPITSNNRDAMMPTLSRAKVPLLYATNYEGGGCDRYLFSFNTVPNQELEKLLPIMKDQAGSSFYLFGADYVWPQKMFETATTIIGGIGGTVAGKEFTPFGVKDFAPVIRRIQDSGAKVLVFALPGADGITFIRQAEELGLLKTVKVAFLGFGELYLGAFGAGKAQDMWVALPFTQAIQTDAAKEFVAKVRKQSGADTPVSQYVFTHYVSLIAAKAAFEKSGAIDSEALVNGLEGIVVDSPTGKVTVGKDHHVTLEMFTAKTEGDGMVVVDDLGQIAPKSGCA